MLTLAQGRLRACNHGIKVSLLHYLLKHELETQVCSIQSLTSTIHSFLSQVKCIQEEYQKYMEKVRSKAQSAIDMANTLFHTERNDLTAQVDMLVQLIHTRYLMAVS